MIIGAHAIIYSKNPEADRAFFRDVLKFPNVDVGGGWLIFGMPPAEAAFHPENTNSTSCARTSRHSCDRWANSKCRVPRFTKSRGADSSTSLCRGGGALGVYQPRHERPPAAL